MIRYRKIGGLHWLWGGRLAISWSWKPVAKTYHPWATGMLALYCWLI